VNDPRKVLYDVALLPLASHVYALSVRMLMTSKCVF